MDLDRGLISGLLAATLSSPRFEKSRRQCELLSHIVTETLEGRGERINAYSIAFDVMGRNSDFDPKLDSIVRVEMHRLRQNLIAWRDDPENPATASLVIDARQYLPQVVARDPVPPCTRPAVAGGSWFERFQRLPRSRKIFVALAPIGFLAAVVSLFLTLRSPLDCRSQRPGLRLPKAIVGVADTNYSNDLLVRLETFLGYYPLVSTRRTEGQPSCRGVPQFRSI